MAVRSENAWGAREAVISADGDTMNFLVWVQVGQIVTALIGIAAAVWAFQKWRVRDEHFPRLYFEVGVNFIGRKDGRLVCELVASLDNKGVVPIKFKELNFVLRGIAHEDALATGDKNIRYQLNFARELCRGRFIPETWEYSFVYPGVATEYNFVTTIPLDIEFVRMQGDFVYPGNRGETHHAAKVLAVPTGGGASAPSPSVEA